MKKALLYLFVGLSTVAMQANAGTPKNIRNTQATRPASFNSFSQQVRGVLSCDSLMNIGASDTLVLYTDSIGYVTGQNSYGDLGKAERFTNLNHVNGTVNGVLIFMAVASAANSTDTFSVNVWDESGGMPGAIIGNTNYSYQGAVDDIAAQTITAITFPNPPVVSDYFYAGVQFDYAAGDTLSIYSNIDGNTSPSTAWELWSDGTSWYPFDDIDSWGLSISLAIIPIVCDGVAGVPNVAYDKNVAIYPTLAQNQLNVLISNSTSDATVDITDLSGRLVLSKKLNTMTDHIHQLDLSSVSAGTYMVNATYGTYHSTNKIIVQK